MMICFKGCGQLLNFSLLHHGYPVGHGQRFFLIMRHENESDADLVLKGLQFDLHLLPQFSIPGG
jgi:hypothetical protein